ncbi:MAG: helix-turn-helix domain-containing protein [Rhodospirillaceae bacterium]|nr:helix-turn-helix domain-containing protein [Rhodospirillaceae bacterium]
MTGRKAIQPRKVARRRLKTAVTKRPAEQQVAAHSVSRALNIIGDRATLLILNCALLGVRRFNDFKLVTGLAPSLLTDRLQRLTEAKVMRRVAYSKRPIRYEYRLTKMGVGLHDTALMMIRWERRWHFDPASPMQRPVHAGCGKEFTPEFMCSACGHFADARDVYAVDGPGAGLDKPRGPRAQRRSTKLEEEPKTAHPMLERAGMLLGDRWTSHVIAAAFRGAKRFADFQDRLKIASNILADRLGRLVDAGILKKQQYEVRPKRLAYRLTDEGRDIFPLIMTLMAWGDRWLDGGKGPPLIVRHKACGAKLIPKITCNHCGEVVDHHNVTSPHTEALQTIRR